MTLRTECAVNAVEAARVLGGDSRSRLSAGGTLLMRAVNEGDPSFDLIVRHADPQVLSLRLQADRLHIGAAVTMSALLASPDAACLHAAARQVGGPAIRNMATVGGNLFAPSPYGDLATALLALDATYTSVDDTNPRPLESLFALRATHTVAGSPIARPPVVLELQCRRPAAEADFRFLKVSRVKPKGISVMAIAVHLPGSATGARLQQVRIAFGAMGATPLRAVSAERALEGQTLGEPSIAAATAVALDGLHPDTDAIASRWYRQTVAPVHLGRALRAGGRR